MTAYIFKIITLLGGLALFLYGMNTMGDGLAKLSGGKLEKILEKLTSNRLMAVVLGAGVTAVIQSSSATTVMVVGFVNAGLMTLFQATAMIMGANIGTTITAQIASLGSFDVALYATLLAFIGAFMNMLCKKEKPGLPELLYGTIIGIPNFFSAKFLLGALT